MFTCSHVEKAEQRKVIKELVDVDYTVLVSLVGIVAPAEAESKVTIESPRMLFLPFISTATVTLKSL